MTQVQKVKLRPWQEIVGKCVEAYMAEDKFVILIETQPRKFKLSLPIFVEPQVFLGQTVGVIRTDDEKRPFIIRKISMAKTTADTATESAATTTLEEETT
jgi:hypothetical protein